MKNVVGVLLSVLGLYGFVWGLTASLRWSVGVAGVVLMVTSLLLLIDVEELT